MSLLHFGAPENQFPFTVAGAHSPAFLPLHVSGVVDLFDEDSRALKPVGEVAAMASDQVGLPVTGQPLLRGGHPGILQGHGIPQV